MGIRADRKCQIESIDNLPTTTMTESKPANFVAVNCRIPREIHEKMQAVTKITQKSSAQVVGTSIEAYVRWLWEEDYENDQMQVDKFAVGLAKKKE